MENNEAEKADENVFVTTDLDILVQETVIQQGLRWRLDFLNKSLGSIRKGDFGLVFARPESFSRDTEVLTPNGWLRVDEVTLETEIAQVNSDLTTSFVFPKAIHPHEQDYCYHIHDTLGRVDLIVTEGHGMIYEKNGKLFKERADSVQYKQGIKHHVSAKARAHSRNLNPMERLAIAYQADGHTRNYKGYGYTFSFNKERKIKRLKGILDQLNFEYTTYQDGTRGHTGFYVKTTRPLIKDFSWINLDEKSAQWCQEFIEELSYWDATRRTATRYKYDTTDIVSANMVQAVCMLAGYNCLMSKSQDNRKETYKDVYSLSIRTNYQPVDGQCIKKERIPFTDTTFCFEVVSGMLLVRRNGATAVSGNTGKTTFLASEISFMLEQADAPIIWFNNEEQGNKVMLRVYQAFFGVQIHQILNNVKEYKEEFLKRAKDKFLLVDNALIDKRSIENIVERVKPGLIVYDQITKIKGFKADREDQMLGAACIWARELAKAYAPSIGIMQAGGVAEGQKWLTMDHVAKVKTEVQAEADFIVGIGKTHDRDTEFIRYLNISKNKLFGDTDSLSNLKHGRSEVLIQPQVARYKDIVNYD